MADESTWQPIVVLLVLLCMLVAMFFEVWTPPLVMITALLVVWNCGIIDTDDALSGFSNSGMITVGCLFVIVKGVEKSHVFERIAGRVFGMETSKHMALLRLMLLSFTFSSIFNNTPIVAILLPITRDWARSRGFAPSEFLIPLSFSSILGGVMTMIGTSTNLVIAGLLEDDRRESFNFIDPAILGAPLGILSILYMLFTAPWLLPNDKGGLFRQLRDNTNKMVTEMEVLVECPLLAAPVSTLLEKLNLTSQSLIKIRRRIDVLDWSEYREMTRDAAQHQSGEELSESGKAPKAALPTAQRTSGVTWSSSTPMLDEETGSVQSMQELGDRVSTGGSTSIPDREVTTQYYASQKKGKKKPRTLAIGRGKTMEVGESGLVLQKKGESADHKTPGVNAEAGAGTSASTKGAKAKAPSRPAPVDASSGPCVTLSSAMDSSASGPSRVQSSADEGDGYFSSSSRRREARRLRSQRNAQRMRSGSTSADEQVPGHTANLTASLRYDLEYMNKTSKHWRLPRFDGPKEPFAVPCEICLLPKPECKCTDADHAAHEARLKLESNGAVWSSDSNTLDQLPPAPLRASASFTEHRTSLTNANGTGDGASAPFEDGNIGYDLDDDVAAYASPRPSRDDSEDPIDAPRHFSSEGHDVYDESSLVARAMQNSENNERAISGASQPTLTDNDEGNMSEAAVSMVKSGSKGELFPIRVSTAKGSLVGEVSGDNIIEINQGARKNQLSEVETEGSIGRTATLKYVDIFPVPEGETLEEGDIVFFMTGHGDALKKLYDKNLMKGLRILDASIYDLAGFGTDLVEVVLSRKNKYIGRQVSGFGKYYGGSVVAVRNVSNKHEMAKGTLHAGDMLLLVMSDEKLEALRQNFNRHFYTITIVGHIPPPVETWDYGGIILFFAMLFCLVFVPKDIASEVQIVMTTMMLMVGGNWVNAQDALTSVDFPLLGLIGAALSLARSVTSSGLADSIAGFVKDTEFSPLGAMYIVSGLSMLLTNVVTNNAAAALSVPIALSIADALDVSYKPFVMSVLYAASISFMTPIGYQTNTMIWGPGGYTFTDFMKIGIPLNLVYLVLACSLLPYIFPFDEKN